MLKDLIVKRKLFLFAFLSGIRINLVGVIPLGELIAVMFSSPKAFLKGLKKIPDLKKISIAYIVFLLCQIISDIFNRSSVQDFIRGWANIVMAILILNFVTRLLYKRVDFIVVLLAGVVLKNVFFSYSDHVDTQFTLDNSGFVKFRLVIILNNLILLSTYFLLKKNHNRKLSIILLLILYGFFCLAFDNRSNAMMIFFTVLFFIFYNSIKRAKKVGVFLIFIISIIGFNLLYTVYVDKVLSRAVGGAHSYSQLSRLENPYNPLNLLITGRTETYVAILAISEKPILGYGSWAKDPQNRFRRMSAKISGELEKFKALGTDINLIPSHSILLGAWLYAGVGGFLSMVYIMLIFIKRAYYLIMIDDKNIHPYYIIIIFYLLTTIWNFLFSPLSHLRETIPYSIGFIIALYAYRENILEKKYGKH